MVEKLIKVQSELKAPKNQRNNFGKYNYRSCEDILEAVKPLLKKHGLMLTVSDEIKESVVGAYVEARATITDGETETFVTAQAGIDINRKGMDVAQSYGSSSSYARKYALNGLFLIDDTKDADATNEHKTKELPTISDANFDKYLEKILEGGKDNNGVVITEAYLKARHTLSDKQQQELSNA